MAEYSLKGKKFSKLLLSVALGLVIGSYLTKIFEMLPDNVVKQFFTKSVSFGFGFGPDALLLDLTAIKIKLGFTCIFSALSLVGIAIAVYIFRWYT